MPANTVKVDRTTKWGNPFVPGKKRPSLHGQLVKDRDEAYELYCSFVAKNAELQIEARAELAGKNLACWCPLPEAGAEDRCHASVLLRIANS